MNIFQIISIVCWIGIIIVAILSTIDSIRFVRWCKKDGEK